MRGKLCGDDDSATITRRGFDRLPGNGSAGGLFSHEFGGLRFEFTELFNHGFFVALDGSVESAEGGGLRVRNIASHLCIGSPLGLLVAADLERAHGLEVIFEVLDAMIEGGAVSAVPGPVAFVAFLGPLVDEVLECLHRAAPYHPSLRQRK